MKLKIFMTGGTGFIGLPVARLLREEGHDLLLLVLPESAVPEGFKTVAADLSNLKAQESRLKEFSPDLTLHLAWEGIPDFSYANCKKNILNSLALYELLTEIGCKRFITTGSCFEYGKKSGVVNEDDPIAPHNAFTSAKVAIQKLGDAFAKENGLKFIWTRLFYVYGPRQRKESLIPTLIANAKADADPGVKNPFAKNDFVFVDDVAVAISILIKNIDSLKHTTFNIGSGTSTSVGDVAREVYLARKRPAPSLPKAGDPVDFWADISRMEELGWKPRTSIFEGIRKML